MNVEEKSSLLRLWSGFFSLFVFDVRECSKSHA